jgi:diguanylate cyclase (GGDEF)-like protein
VENRRKHYGVIFATMDNANQYEVWRGVHSFAHDEDVNISVYVSAYQGPHGSTPTFLETCFDAVRANEHLDGLILFSGFVAQNTGAEKLAEYVRGLPDTLPIVSISFALPGVPTVLAQGFDGTYNAVTHLAEAHGRRNIAFVKGPDGHPEAEERLSGYKKALEDQGLPIVPELIRGGAFAREHGHQAVADLIELGLPFDAVVASNDQMAIGVLLELKARNILVPADVAVTGFDDDEASASFIPSLSTARQDFFQIGRTGAETLAKILAGEKVAATEYVAPNLILRQSCGCLDKAFSETNYKDSADDTLHSFVLRNFRSLFTQVPAAQVQQWAQALTQAIEAKQKENFLHLINDILVKYSHDHDDLILWHEALSILAVGIEMHGNQAGILSALVSAMAVVHDIRSKIEKNKEVALTGIRDYIRRLTSALVLTFDTDTIAEMLHTSLPVLAIHTALVGIYRNPIRSNDPAADRSIESVIGFDGDTRYNIRYNGGVPMFFHDYPNIEGFQLEKERRSLFYIPLFFEEQELGVLLLPYQSHIPVDTYDRLRISISSAVKGAALLSTIQTLSITDELTGLLNRRGFFQHVYSRMFQLGRIGDVIPIVLFMDMDGLKLINDNHGHKEGDRAISIFANVLKSTLRKEDIIGRIGGDEFVVFSSVKTSEAADQVVTRIRQKLADYNSQSQHPYIVDGSIGCVILTEATNVCFEEAMLNADSVLYLEKSEKRKKGLARH